MNIEQMIQQAPEDRKEAIVQARDYYLTNIVGPHLQWGATPEVCARIILGESPKDIAPQLTQKEAAAWAYQTVHATPEDWLWVRIVAKHPELSVSRAKSIEVMRWAARMMQSPSRSKAMLERRCVFGEGGGEEKEDGHDEYAHEADAADAASSIVQRLDEIEPQDLTPSAVETLQNAVNRQMREQWDGPDELRAHEPWMDELPEGCTVIRTWPQLFNEGREMRHCVSSYAKDIASKRSVIVSIRAGHRRSTAEYIRGDLRQHQAFARSRPHEDCCIVAEEIARKRLIP